MKPTPEEIAKSAEIAKQNLADEKIGERIAECLGLKKNDTGRYDTLWGKKSAIGLTRTLKAIMDEFNP